MLPQTKLTNSYRSPTPSQEYLLADTGCTSHYLKDTVKLPQKPDKQLRVQLPDGSFMESKTSTHLPFIDLNPKATQAHTFQALKTANLLSIGQLCDNDCVATFNKTTVTITKNKSIIMTGKRDEITGMWLIPMPHKTTKLQNQKQTQYSNVITKLHPKSKLVKFLHAAAFSPCKSTWIKAIKAGFFATWPGLTHELVSKFLPNSEHTAMGHLDQEQKNLRSTKPNKNVNEKDGTVKTRTHDVYCHVLEEHIFTDQTGRFPVQSNKGHNYLLIAYDYDTNAILAEPIKNRTTQEIIRAYNIIYETLKKVGCQPRLHSLDNEAPSDLLNLIHKNNCKVELVPPYIHRRNAAERAIRTFKNHLIAGISSVDPNFPMQLWCRLIKQAERTLNMLRPTRINPKISADAYLNGQHDFNSHPMAPPGTKVIAHIKPNQRASWAKHGVVGWYIGPSYKHYRCYRVYIPKTGAERIVDTIQLFSTHSETPEWSANDELLQTAENMVKALQHPDVKLKHLNDNKLQALKQLATIFQTAQTEYIDSPRVKSPALNTVPSNASNKNIPTPHIIPANMDEAPQHENQMDQPAYNTRLQTKRRENAVPHFIHSIIDPDSGKTLEYRHLIQNPKTQKNWTTSCANEFGRLAQGVSNRVQGTNTIYFVPYNKVPKHKTVTYPRIVCDYRPTKSDSNRTRITVGGNLIEYADEVYTATAGLMTAKILFNSVISTPNARCAIFDIKNFYLQSDLLNYEYMRFKFDQIPPEIVKQYHLNNIIHNGWIYVEIRKGMYGLPQSGIVANKDLQKHLKPFGYEPVTHTPGLWKHKDRDIIFTLVVDDFAIKYTKIEDLLHLQNALQSKYTLTIDMEAKSYCGVDITWDYKKRTCQISMPQYIQKLLHKLQHPVPFKPQHSPYKHIPPIYGTEPQTPVPEPKGRSVTPAEKQRIQSIVGSLLYYARAVDPTLLPAINTIAMQISQATVETIEATNRLLDFVATYPQATLLYHQSDMILHAHSDASYLSAPKARSRIAGYFHLTNRNKRKPFNAPIHIECKVLKCVVSSAAEAELGALFENCKTAEVIRTTLTEMGHSQPATTIVTDNSTASGIANYNQKIKQSKTMDMRFFWVRDRVRQRHFNVQWEKGKLNRADYFTKHHSPSHHKRIRPIYITETTSIANTISEYGLRGCVLPLTSYVCNKLGTVMKHNNNNSMYV